MTIPNWLPKVEKRAPHGLAQGHIEAAEHAMIWRAMEGVGAASHKLEVCGKYCSGVTRESFLADFANTFPWFKIVANDYSYDEEAPQLELNTVELVSATGAAALFVSENTTTSIFLSDSKEELQSIRSFMFTRVEPEDRTRGSVHVMMMTDNGPAITWLGVGGAPLIRDNYSPKVLEGYDRIIKDLQAKAPGGRIAILDGPPGSGKSYMIRAILDEVGISATFVIISPDAVVGLGDPSTIACLIKLRNENKGPMVFIVEDADSLLAPRASDNMAGISSILNLGDGIMGGLLDIRLVCTTNAKNADLDKAILRPGRLSANVHVGKLDWEQAQSVLDKLSPGAILPIPGSYSIAEIYAIARDAGWVPVNDEPKMGFKTQPQARIIPGLFASPTAVTNLSSLIKKF